MTNQIFKINKMEKVTGNELKEIQGITIELAWNRDADSKPESVSVNGTRIIEDQQPQTINARFNLANRKWQLNNVENFSRLELNDLIFDCERQCDSIVESLVLIPQTA